MTDPAPRPRGRWIASLLAAALGGYFGAVGASMIKGFLIGLEQMDGAFGWLSVPLSTFAGPMILHADLILLAEGGPYGHLVMLPWWSGVGLLVGVLAGLGYARSPAPKPPGTN